LRRIMMLTMMLRLLLLLLITGIEMIPWYTCTYVRTRKCTRVLMTVDILTTAGRF
jgi:hypothetical protein